MNLQQLRSVREVVKRDFSITRAAEHLRLSQPAISRHVQMLETELGVPLFTRDRNRLVGLTGAGEALLPLAARAAETSDDLLRTAREFAAGDSGSLTIATAHTHARYSLPPVIERFVARYPRVRLRLRQGYLRQIAQWVSEGTADLFIATAPTERLPNLHLLPCHTIHRVVLTSPSHPLLGGKITLGNLAGHPIITYGEEFAARGQIERAFATAGFEPNIVLSATDTDVMKTYVQCGLGVAIVAHPAYDKEQDRGLRAIDARHLFPSSMVHVGMRRHAHLSRHARYFIDLFAPRLKRAVARLVQDS